MVLFLVMAALFRSTKDSLYVILTIPLASFGGVLALVRCVSSPRRRWTCSPWWVSSSSWGWL